MKKSITELMAVIVILLLSVLSVKGQTGVTLIDTNFADWKPTIATDQANGTYTVPNASVKIQGPKFNNSSTPNAGTNTTYPNYFRFGSAGSTTNNYLEITPDGSFVKGGKVTIVISTNATAAATDVFSIADSEASNINFATTFANFAQIGKTFTEVSVILPETYSGKKTIRLFRTSATTFLHAVKIETNPATIVPDTKLKDLKVDGVAVTGFDPATLTYDVELPYTYAGIPVVSGTINDNNSAAIITQATAVPGAATINVTQTSVDPTLYTINFSRTPVSTACDITSFTLGGQTGIINTIDNTITVGLYSNADITALTPTVVVSTFANYTPTTALNFSTPQTFVVTAQDGLTQKTYTVTVNLIEAYSGIYPYETIFPTDFTIPAWMTSPTNGISFTNAYAGADASHWFDSGETTNASVIRLNSYTSMDFYMSKCGKISAGLSATGDRVYNLYVNNEKVFTSPTQSKNTNYQLVYDVNLNEPVLIRLENTGNGGATLGHLKIEASFDTHVKEVGISNVTFDGRIIHNATHTDLVVYNAVGRRIISSNQNIDMSLYANGIYILKSNDQIMKLMLSK